MKLSTALNILALSLLLTSGSLAFFTKDKHSIGQIYQDARSGTLRSSLYTKIITPVAIRLGIVVTYSAMTSRCWQTWPL